MQPQINIYTIKPQAAAQAALSDTHLYTGKFEVDEQKEAPASLPSLPFAASPSALAPSSKSNKPLQNILQLILSLYIIIYAHIRNNIASSKPSQSASPTQSHLLKALQNFRILNKASNKPYGSFSKLVGKSVQAYGSFRKLVGKSVQAYGSFRKLVGKSIQPYGSFRKLVGKSIQAYGSFRKLAENHILFNTHSCLSY